MNQTAFWDGLFESALSYSEPVNVLNTITNLQRIWVIREKKKTKQDSFWKLQDLFFTNQELNTP